VVDARRGQRRTGDGVKVPASPTAGTLRGTPRRLVRATLLGVARPAARLRIAGLEHVPATGPVLVVSNHLHNADPALLGMAFPRPLYFMAKRELFGNRAFGALMRWLGAFPVDRGKADRAAIRQAEALLAAGEAVAMFPEGTRSATGKLGAGQPGVGLILLRSNAPVLPVAITGTEKLPGGPGATITFGVPRTIPRGRDGGRLGPQQATDAIMAAIAELLPAEYLP
jgi:1-acyl-sn-glycerol-3-phosphate acyltransferase